MKQTFARVRFFALVAGLLVVLSGAYAPSVAFAVPQAGNEQGGSTSTDPALECLPGESGAGKCDLFKKYINPIIWFLSAAVGLAVTIGIIMGGIRYATSGGDPSQAANAKNQIRNAVIAMVAFLFLLAALNWLVPGGLR